MKKVYEKPELEKTVFETDENVCAGLFSDLFKLQFASNDLPLTKEAVFDWSQLQ